MSQFVPVVLSDGNRLTVRIDTHRYYVLGAGKYAPLFADVGYCRTCSDFTPVETLSDADGVLALMSRLSMDDEMRDTYTNYLNVIVPRGTPPKCLECGSEDFVHLSQERYEVIEQIGLSAILERSEWYSDGFFPRYYTTDGNYLGREASLEVFYQRFPRARRNA